MNEISTTCQEVVQILDMNGVRFVESHRESVMDGGRREN